MGRVLLLTGTCGSGKTTVSSLIAQRPDWLRIGEDEIWYASFRNKRGSFGSREHRSKRQRVHAIIFSRIMTALRAGYDVVIDATVHESPPEEFEAYRAFFLKQAIVWCVRVLHPRMEVAVARDASRMCWTIGGEGVRDMRARFNGKAFGIECFLDNSDETPEETMWRLLSSVERHETTSFHVDHPFGDAPLLETWLIPCPDLNGVDENGGR